MTHHQPKMCTPIMVGKGPPLIAIPSPLCQSFKGLRVCVCVQVHVCVDGNSDTGN